MIEFDNDSRYLNNNREYIERFDDSLLNDTPSIKIVENGYILPKSEIYLCKGGVADENREYVTESGIDNNGSFICIDGSYEFDEFREGECDEIIYLGYFYRHWGHFLMDCTTRMWILLDDRYKDTKVSFQNHPAQTCDGNYSRFLQLIGLDEDRIVRDTVPTRYKRIIVPEEARHESDRRHMDCWYRIFDKAVANAYYERETVPDKVFFSRGLFGKPEYGEEEIQQNFEKNGYSILYPEKLSVDEQIGIFQCAGEIVSENSSICMNVVFARKGLKWTVINKYSAVHENFSELRYEKDIDIEYVDAYEDRLNYYGNVIGTRPYLMSFNQNMIRYFEDRGYEYSLYDRGYRIKNVVRYLINCVTILIKNKISRYAANTVRWMKRNTPELIKILKRIKKSIY